MFIRITWSFISTGSIYSFFKVNRKLREVDQQPYQAPVYIGPTRDIIDQVFFGLLSELRSRSYPYWNRALWNCFFANIRTCCRVCVVSCRVPSVLCRTEWSLLGRAASGRPSRASFSTIWACFCSWWSLFLPLSGPWYRPTKRFFAPPVYTEFTLPCYCKFHIFLSLNVYVFGIRWVCPGHQQWP